MTKLTCLFFNLIVFASLNCCFSQDRIYLNSDKRDGKVTEITPEKIKYKNPQNPGPVYTVSREKVAFVFNNAGNYCVITNDQNGSPDLFLQSSNSFPASDIVLTINGARLNCTIDKEENGYLFYTVKNEPFKIDVNSIAVAIYKNGQHKVYATDYKLVSEVLRKNEGVQPITRKDIAAAPASTVAPDPNLKKPVEKSVAVSSTEPVLTTGGKQVNSTAAVKTAPAVDDGELEIDYDEYEKRSIQKTQELSNYLKLLCDKTTEYDRAEKAIGQACMLFINEDATVSVSSKNNKNLFRYKIRDYLKKLKLIRYDRVDIEWTNIQYVSKLRKGPDGNYYGVISFEQTFRGYADNKLVYSDVTRKNIEIVLVEYKKSVEGKTRSSWDVLLSDIGIVETRSSL